MKPKVHESHRAFCVTSKKLYLLLTLVLLSFFTKAGQVDSLKQAYSSVQNEKQKLVILLELVEAYINTDPSKAGNYPDEAVKLAARLKDHANLSLAYVHKGYIEMLTDHNDKAYTLFDRALKVATDHKIDSMVATATYSHGALAQKQGHYSKALEYHHKAVKYFESAKKYDELANSYKFIGILYDIQKNQVESLKYFKKALDIDIQRGNEFSMGQSLNNVGTVLFHMGKKEEALPYFRRSVAAKIKVGNRRGLGSSVINLGLYFADKKQYDSALVYFNRCISLATEVHSQYQLALAYSYRGDAYAHMGRDREALKDLLLAREICEEQQFKVELADVHKKLSFVYRNLHDAGKAYENLEKYIALKDTQALEENTRLIKEMQAKYEADKKEAEINDLNKQKRLDELEKKQLSAENDRQKNILIIGFVILLLAVLLGFFVYRSYVQKKKANLLLHEKNLMIEEKQREIVDSINYAKRIQYTLLAHDALLRENLPEHFVFFKPKDIVSGDFYWATQVQRSRFNVQDSKEGYIKPETLNQQATEFYLAVCDSTGHGVPGAFMSLLNISFLNEAINEKNMASPGKVFDHVRKRLIEQISQESARDRVARDGMDGILARFENNGSLTRMEYAAANNKPVIVRKGEIMTLDCDKMPVGYSDKVSAFNVYRTDLQKGDCVFFYTDGYADQFGGAGSQKGKKFKYKNLNTLLAKLSGENAFAQMPKLLERHFEEWRGGIEQIDDVCVIGVRI